jgi:DNA-binding MarR family transcriptional regulator
MYEGRANSPNTPNTVVLNERDVADAARLLSILAGDNAKLHAGAIPSNAEDVPSKHLDPSELSRRVVASRKARYRHFSRAMFGEPAWDMLLAIYSWDAAGTRQTIGRITERSGAPMTSALRWLQYLEKESLVRREPHPNDRRTVFIELTEKGRRAVVDCLFSIAQQLGLG